VIVVDDRWLGSHGISRFANEVISRLDDVERVGLSGNPSGLWQIFSLHVKLLSKKRGVFFTPGFNAPVYSPIPFIFTLHDLIHLNSEDATNLCKKIYYNVIIRRSAQRAFKILTVSDYSKRDILNWLNISEQKVVVAKCGVSNNFSLSGKVYESDYPYIFCLGNMKPHKNIIRLINAFAWANIDKNYRLLIATKVTSELKSVIKSLDIENRIVFSGFIDEADLPAYYRGAKAFVFPSLYEGFGLPILEAMACGTPVITSNVTAMPEIAGEAAILIDPYNVNSIAHGIERVIDDAGLQQSLRNEGLERVKEFTWDKTAAVVRDVLEQALKVR
jgi:glycosyltransferase involved in cell wall biosynthesis